MQACQLVVLVPSRELGVQTALLVYKLFGGSVSQGIPGNRSNMFRYCGPRNLQVRTGQAPQALLQHQQQALCRSLWCAPAASRACACLHTLTPTMRHQVRGILDDQEAALAKESQVLLNTHVCVATPHALADVLAGGAGHSCQSVSGSCLTQPPCSSLQQWP